MHLQNTLQHGRVRVSEPPVIAIVDDDASIREALQSLLRPVGWRAAGFASAEDFLQSGQGQTTACLLLDVRLPGMSGLELQRQLGASYAHLPIIFRTSVRSLHIVEGSMAASMEALDSHRITNIRERFAGGRYIREVQHCTTHGRHRADPRGNRHGQGTERRHPCAQCTLPPSARVRELYSDPC